MENFAAILLPAVVALLLFRLIHKGVRWVLRLLLNAGCGLVCLGILNSAAGFTGITVPVNALTVLTAGTLGLPGIGLLALLEVL